MPGARSPCVVLQRRTGGTTGRDSGAVLGTARWVAPENPDALRRRELESLLASAYSLILAKLLSRVRAEFLQTKTAYNPASLLPVIRETVARLNPSLPMVSVPTLDEQIEHHLRQERLFAPLCDGFAALAVELATLGLVGVLAYRVNRRQAELGIRLALGAPRLRLWWMVVGEGWSWLAAGLGSGVVAANYSTSLVQKFPYGLRAQEYANRAAPIAVLRRAGLLAVAIPAWRACRVDPMVALRQD